MIDDGVRVAVEIPRGSPRLRGMAEPARRLSQAENPPIDPDAVGRAYRLERAKRRARVARTRRQRLASVRFAAVLIALLALTVFLTLTIWQQIERLFGL